MMKKILFLVLCLGFFSSNAFAQDESETVDLTDYKTACLEAIDNLSKIGGGINLSWYENIIFQAAINGAKGGLDECETKEAMSGIVSGLRALVIGKLQTQGTFNDGLPFTGLIGNHSFDTGDLSSWYTVGFDLTKIDIAQVTQAITQYGDVSGLIDAVTVNEWKEDTKAVENQGDNAVQGGHNKFYLNSDKQLIMQPIIGLPAGVYNFSAKVTCNLWTFSSVYLNALVVPMNVIEPFLETSPILPDINWTSLISGDFNEIFSNYADKLPELYAEILQNIEPFLTFGKLYSGGKSGFLGLNIFSSADMRFIVDEGDVVILCINSGATQFIGAEQYRADNLKLTGIRSVDIKSAKANLAAAIEGLSVVEANYNADATAITTQPAFTYNKTITENYNRALLAAQDKYKDKLRDILTPEDLDDDHIDGIDSKIRNYFNSEISTLNEAKEAFEKNAFIAPTSDKPFNITMRGTTSEWAGNAVSIDEDMTMRFNQKAGESVFALAFNFEKASNVYSNRLFAFVNDGLNTYYLGEKNGSLALTTDKSEAAIITAVPSYTKEGEIQLMIGGICLGTTSSNDILVKTDEETELSVYPAAAMDIKVKFPTGWDYSTLMLPFDAHLPGGVSACIVTGIAEDLPYVIEGETVTKLKANTPYCIMTSGGNYTFSGVPHVILPAYGEGLLIGRHSPYTTQGGNEYKLTIDTDGYTIFSQADGEYIAENECYLKSNNSSDVIFMRKVDAVTGIASPQSSILDPQSPVYNLAGQKVNGTLPRGIYIVNGKKVLR